MHYLNIVPNKKREIQFDQQIVIMSLKKKSSQDFSYMYDVIHSIMFNLENWSFAVLKKIVCAIKNGLFKISVVLFTK